MGIENFIRDALHQPHDYVAYYVARELAELHPDKTIVEGTNWKFDLEAFVRAGKCSVVAQKSVLQHTRIMWEGRSKKLKPRTQNAWLGRHSPPQAGRSGRPSATSRKSSRTLPT